MIEGVTNEIGDYISTLFENNFVKLSTGITKRIEENHLILTTNVYDIIMNAIYKTRYVQSSFKVIIPAFGCNLSLLSYNENIR